ncbi:TBC1 domain family member 20-like isoform X1 [Gopherus flavomarginatus]|uniref:TBC1 domain family member 20-like isoform X1 n=2 Tax=Gopherus flavomarginatus TaxID=286002 RepID=UPI0021CBB248|nr:TBC1 domain family member 20-like isoform X1 [Gopherus flavomarginatus]
MACPFHSQQHVSSAFDCPSPMDRVPASQLDELEGAIQCEVELNLQPSGLQLDTLTPQRQRDRELPGVRDTLQGCNFAAGKETNELLCGTAGRTCDGRAGELSEPNRTGEMLGSKRKQKLLLIHQALTSDPVAVETLRGAAVSEGGLLTDEIRRKVWPKLLSVNVYNLPPKPGRAVRQNHKDYTQVQLDVSRSTHRFPQGMRAEQRRVLQEQLIDLILHILRAHPELHYYQGYHDITVTLLLVAGERMGSALLEKLSTHHLRDFMDPTMDSTKHILNYLMPILQRESLRLHDFMLRAEVGTIFALSWLITWYGHVLTSFPHILRLYDFFLASHPLMPVYFAAVIVLHREAEVLACDCDMPSVHQLLSQIPQNLPYERLIFWALQLFQRHPHAELAKQAALQHHKSISIGSFSAFQLATTQQRPDAVLRRQRQQDSAHAEAAALLPMAGHSPLVKAAVWGISATLGAAALAVTQTALEWAPEFLLQLF